MIDHLSLSVPDLRRTLAFYDVALAPLGIVRMVAVGGTDDLPDHVGYGDGRRAVFWVGGGGAATGLHLAFAARDRAAVDAFHAAALAAGARDNGAPGLRPEYHASYYGAFVIDPAGVNLEAVHHGP